MRTEENFGKGLRVGILLSTLLWAAGALMWVNWPKAEEAQWSGVSVTMPVSTYSALPVCNAALQGTAYIVTDALLPSYLSIVIAGGAVKVPVVCNGTNWIGF